MSKKKTRKVDLVSAYDADIDVGSVVLAGEHARAIVLAVADSLRSGKHSSAIKAHMLAAVTSLNNVFRLGIGEPKRFAPGTAVLWGRSRWKVVEWQPDNGIGGSYWLRNAKGKDGVAGPDEVRRAPKRKVAK